MPASHPTCPTRMEEKEVERTQARDWSPQGPEEVYTSVAGSVAYNAASGAQKSDCRAVHWDSLTFKHSISIQVNAQRHVVHYVSVCK